MSSQGESSVNGAINVESFLPQNIRVDDVIRKVTKQGAGESIAKFDVEAAYRNIPVHPYKSFLLRLKWSGQFFLDLVLFLAWIPHHSFLTRLLL